ncbi:MAG: 5'-nucleotidase C-terminal domain-containing protein [Steroidobacteraceae bacterium]
MISRRGVIKATVGLSLAGAGVAVGRWGVASPPPSKDGADVATLMRRVFESLSEEARAAAMVPFDHPHRQYYNRGLSLGGVMVAPGSLGWSGRRDLAALANASLSAAGPDRVFGQGLPTWSGVNFTHLLFCGDPRGSGSCQAILSTTHLNLRLGGKTVEGAAFGGAQVYGDQRGDNLDGLPGNVFRYQMEHAHRLIASLSPGERAAVRVDRAPAQTNIGLQGEQGRFDGLAVGNLSASQRALARATVGSIFDTYSEGDAAYAWECLERNGGIDALHFADYAIDFQEDQRRFGDAPSQVFRFEGPAAVLHFRGYPHLHAFLNVAMDGERPQGIGEQLAVNPRRLEGEDLRVWFEAAMRSQARADVAIYPAWNLVGRLREGPVTTGDVWVAESWADELVVIETLGSDLSPALAKALRSRGTEPQSGRTYRVALPGYLVRGEAGRQTMRIAAQRSLGPLRDALAVELRTHGFISATA